MTEPGAGSDLQGIRTTAEDRGDHWLLNGSKTFISNGILADLVDRRRPDHPGGRRARASRLLVVERGTAGFERGRNLDKIGQKAQDTAELFFNDVRVPKENLLGERERRLRPPDDQPRPGAAGASRSPGSPRAEHLLEITTAVRQGARGVRAAARQAPAHPVRDRRDGHRVRRHPDLRRPLHRRALATASSTPCTPRWPSGGPPNCRSASPTAACNCTAATATWREYPGRQGVHRRPHPDHLRRDDRDHEGDHRPLPARLTRPPLRTTSERLLTVSTEAYVYDAIRTPRGRGKANGALHGTKPIDLVVGLIHETPRPLPRTSTRPPSTTSCSASSARSATRAPTSPGSPPIAAGLPDTVAGVQENRFCASGLEAVNMAAAKVRSGWEDLVLAGGVESMSRVPMGSDGGAWFDGPDDQPRHRLRAAGHRRRPHRHHRGLLPARRRRVRGPVPGARRRRPGRTAASTAPSSR